TILIDPAGKVVAEYEGNIDNGKLVAELEKSLVAGQPVVPSMAPNTLRIGQLPPNFLFEYSPGHEVTLRKIIGRPVVVVFWRASSSQSIEVIHDLSRTSGASQPPMVLAVNDGDAPDAAKKAAAENGVTAIVVTDPSRSIARAYGIDTWPTAVSIDALGLVRAVRNGRTESDSDDSSVQQHASASRSR
ncbi:MAG: redoxin domain-containing protein, partial [Gemmatimonadota bacterium]|nr:redoxin domain-containing protein [Gemmatimonadota bacterium]